MRFWIISVKSRGTENIERPPWPLLLKDHRAPISLNETLFFRPWLTQNLWLCLSYCYINVASFIHSRITNSVKVVCFKAFVHKSNSNLCSTACWGGYAIRCNIFTDRRIMNQVCYSRLSLSPRLQNQKWTNSFIFPCNSEQTHCLIVFRKGSSTSAYVDTICLVQKG